MTWRREQQKRRAPTATVSSRAEWRTFIKDARQCATDAVEGVNDADAAVRLMTLARRASHASSSVLDRDAGATVADVARAFTRVAVAFARPVTPSPVRVALAPLIDALGEFLDDQLHALNTGDFERAHAGRPEVYG